jgi:hypothetical protein
MIRTGIQDGESAAAVAVKLKPPIRRLTVDRQCCAVIHHGYCQRQLLRMRGRKGVFFTERLAFFVPALIIFAVCSYMSTRSTPPLLPASGADGIFSVDGSKQ